MTEVVKSSYVVDPNDEMGLIRRNNEGTEIDREYWDRVNQERSLFIFFTIFNSNGFYLSKYGNYFVFRVKMF